MCNVMEITDERFDPSQQGRIKYEHLHRYALAREFAAGKDVLDIACGEGYGSAMLARDARSVVGVDVDAEVVEHARQKYGDDGSVTFLAGSCDSIPLPDECVDVVASFETIEHHDKHQEMMREIRRVLRPGGILLLSSPNRLSYSDASSFTNPFHVKELYYEELDALLKEHFECVSIYGQQVAAGSFVFSLHETDPNDFSAYISSGACVSRQNQGWRDPLFFLAVCMDHGSANIGKEMDSVLLDVDYDLIEECQSELTRVHHAYAEVHAYAKSMETHIEDVQMHFHETQKQLHEARAHAQAVEARLRETQSQLSAMESSRFWKLRTRLLKLRRWLSRSAARDESASG